MWGGGRVPAALCLLAVAVEAETVSSMDHKLDVIQNIGYYMQIGQGFDMRKHEPVNALVAPPEVVEAHTAELDTPMVSQTFSMADSFEDKKKLMDLEVSGEFAMQSGAMKLEGSGSFKYLKDKKTTKKMTTMAYQSLVHTKTKVLNVFHPDVTVALTRHLIDSKLATHVVTEILYGQRTLATFKSEYDTEEQKKNLEFSLQIALETASFTGSIKGEFKQMEENSKGKVKVESTLYSDSVPSERAPTEFAETLEFVTTAHDRMGGEIGVPVTYKLTPLHLLDDAAARLVAEMDKQTVAKVRAVFQELDEGEIELNDLVRMRARGNNFWLERAVRLRTDFTRWRGDFVQRLGAALQAKVANTGDPDALSLLLQEYYGHGTFELRRLRLKVGEMEDELIMYQKLVSPSDGRGVLVAQNRADLMGPVFATTNDNTYVLVVVDSPRAQGHLQTTAAFYDFAESTFKKDKPRNNADGQPIPQTRNPGRNCIWTLPEGEPSETVAQRQESRKCEETLAFVAMHFDTLCSAVCPKKYCFTYNKDDPRERPCATELDELGEPKASGNCMPTEARQNLTKCWPRPAVEAEEAKEELPETEPQDPPEDEKKDDSMDGVEVAAEDKEEESAIRAAFPEEWCACPYTQVVQFLRTGEDRAVEVIQIAVPRTVAVTDVDVSVVRPGEPENQLAVLTVMHPPGQDAGQVLRHKVMVMWNQLDEQTGNWFEVSRVYETYTNDLPIRVMGLKAGWLYRFRVAGVNSFGAGPWSDPSVRVMAASNMPTLTARPTGRQPVRDQLPSWRVGNERYLEVDVVLSAQNEANLTTVLLEHDSGVIECDVIESTRTTAKCLLQTAELDAAGPQDDVPVRVIDDSGFNAANGVVDVVAASARSCQLFEVTARADLCDAQLDKSMTKEQIDPLNQMVELKVRTQDYERSPSFGGWIVRVTEVGKPNGRETLKFHNDPTLRVWGLRAGARYVFELAARVKGQTDDAERKWNNKFPQSGHDVARPMVVLEPVDTKWQLLRNRVPLWPQFNDGYMKVNVWLTVKAKSRPMRLQFKVTETDYVGCQFTQTTDDPHKFQCEIPVQLLFAQANKKPILEARVLDVSGNELAKGKLAREAPSESTCETWMGNNGVLCRTSTGDYCTEEASITCSTCDEQNVNAYEMVKVDERTCSWRCTSGNWFCPYTGQCVSGCTSCTQTDGGKTYKSFQVPSLRLCAVGCRMKWQLDGMSAEMEKVVMPGVTQGFQYCEGASFAAQADERFDLACPDDNTQAVAKKANGKVAPWYDLVKPEITKCVSCTAAANCNDRADSVTVDDSYNCICACKGKYGGNSCEKCVAGHYLQTVNSVVTCVPCTRKVCNSHGEGKVSADSTKCECTCDKGYDKAENCKKCAKGYSMIDGKCQKSAPVPWFQTCPPGTVQKRTVPAYDVTGLKCEQATVLADMTSNCLSQTQRNMDKTCKQFGIARRDTKRLGGELSTEPSSGDTLKQCNDKCCAEKECWYYTWTKEGGKCMLFGSKHTGQVQYQADTFSGEIGREDLHPCYADDAPTWCNKRRKTCTLTPCPAGEIYCPAKRSCVTATDDADRGCGANCEMDSVPNEEQGICHSGCKIVIEDKGVDVNVAAGTQEKVEFCKDEVGVTQVNVTISCPEQNTEPVPVGEDGLKASWWKEVDVPSCEKCTIEERNCVKDATERAEIQEGVCVCVCKAGFEGDSCDMDTSTE